MTIPEFFDKLKDGEEYLSLLCTKEAFSKINSEGMVINSVRQKNESFKEDIEHKGFIKALRKAKKDLQNYEYEKNNV